MARWMGVDYGTKRIGLAIGELSDNICISLPSTTLIAAGTPAADARLVADFAQSQNAFGIVVGLPLNMDDTIGPQAKLTVAFVEQLRKATSRVVETCDERLSSFAADELMQQSESRNRKSGQRDALAASVILQAFLNARRGPRQQPTPPDEPGEP